MNASRYGPRRARTGRADDRVAGSPYAACRRPGRWHAGTPSADHLLPGGATPVYAGHELVVVSSRLPVRVTGPGPARRQPAALTTAFEPVVEARHGAWLGWSGVPDRNVKPVWADHMWLYPLALSAAEVSDHLQGQCESTISPLYHDAVVHPMFEQRWCDAYRQVNRRYADAAADLAAPGAMVWVHGHQLQLVPALLRQLRPDLRIGFFLHIPFPPPGLFTRLPLREEIVEGLLGADVVGFQHSGAVENFLAVADTVLGLRPEAGYLALSGRRIVVDAFPQSVDVARIEKLAADETVRARAAGLRTGLGKPRTVLLAVDRLDPAKGIEQRLTAYAELLLEDQLDPAETVLVQVVAPEEHPNEEHRRLRGRVEQQVGRINGVHGQLGLPAVHYQHRLLEPADLVALYLAADVLLATPLRDGMNLTAKEYVAARTDHAGAVVLSEFTATAEAFPQAFVVNPHDIDAVKRVIRQAIHTEPDVLRSRMSVMRQHVLTHDVRVWARRLLSALGQDATPTGAQADPRRSPPQTGG